MPRRNVVLREDVYTTGNRSNTASDTPTTYALSRRTSKLPYMFRGGSDSDRIRRSSIHSLLAQNEALSAVSSATYDGSSSTPHVQVFALAHCILKMSKDQQYQPLISDTLEEADVDAPSQSTRICKFSAWIMHPAVAALVVIETMALVVLVAVLL
ncbi:hypothetical protein B0H19DRAFT_1077141 [Mycena capillaripes]|nr:hypothetical protein B0H19DRAFT_1077141 [Mycena capillaripes]